MAIPGKAAYAPTQNARIKPFKPNDLVRNIAWAWQASHGEWAAALQTQAVVAKIPDFRFSASKFG
jgi:hypothetical protein